MGRRRRRHTPCHRHKAIHRGHLRSRSIYWLGQHKNCSDSRLGNPPAHHLSRRNGSNLFCTWPHQDKLHQCMVGHQHSRCHRGRRIPSNVGQEHPRHTVPPHQKRRSIDLDLRRASRRTYHCRSGWWQSTTFLLGFHPRQCICSVGRRGVGTCPMRSQRLTRNPYRGLKGGCRCRGQPRPGRHRRKSLSIACARSISPLLVRLLRRSMSQLRHRIRTGRNQRPRIREAQNQSSVVPHLSTHTFRTFGCYIDYRPCRCPRRYLHRRGCCGCTDRCSSCWRYTDKGRNRCSWGLAASSTG